MDITLDFKYEISSDEDYKGRRREDYFSQGAFNGNKQINVSELAG